MFASPPKFQCWNLKYQYDGIRMWTFVRWLGRKSRAFLNRIYKTEPQNSFLFQSVKTQQDSDAWTRKWILIRHQICQPLHFWFSSLQTVRSNGVLLEHPRIRQLIAARKLKLEVRWVLVLDSLILILQIWGNLFASLSFLMSKIKRLDVIPKFLSYSTLSWAWHLKRKEGRIPCQEGKRMSVTKSNTHKECRK